MQAALDSAVLMLSPRAVAGYHLDVPHRFQEFHAALQQQGCHRRLYRRQCRHLERQRELAALGQLGSHELSEVLVSVQSLVQLDDDGKAPSHGHTWNHSVGTPSHSQWNGCVTDRDQSCGVDATTPTGKST